jgi:hypothetical protein
VREGERPRVIAEFGGPSALVAAARGARDQGFKLADALTPCPVEGVEEALDLPTSPIRWPMLIAAVAVAAFAYGLEFWSAVYAYPIDSGGRPLNSWPIFVLVPFEVGVLAAAIAGFVALLVLCGLPRLNHPLFDLEPVERATDDRYFLLIEAPRENGEAERLRSLLIEAGALRLQEAPA